MDKALNYLALARKGGLAELGEEPVGAVARTGKAYVVLVAGDASDHSWRRAQSFVSGTSQLCIQTGFTKDQLGQAIGRTSLAMAAFTDPALALAFLKALNDPRNAEAIASLEERTKRIRQRQQEAKAHRRNVKKGKK